MRSRLEQMVFRLTKNLRALAGLAGGVFLAAVCGHALPATAETLNETLAATYRYNPTLDAERARLRVQDEEVARAISGYRPVITGNADVNYQYTNIRPDTTSDGTRFPKGYSVNLTQPIFLGGRVVNAVSEQEAATRAARESLRRVEQDVLLDAVTAFMDVLRDQAIVKLRENNVNVLSRELKATEDRFAVGEVTRTDVAQAQARRSGSVSNLDLARANLKTSRASYERVVGSPPGNLVEPRGFDGLLPKSLQDAVGLGTHQHPLVVESLYLEQSSRFSVDRIRGELLPQVQLEASYGERFDTSLGVDREQLGVVTGRVSVPIYEGGEVYARVRQAKQAHIGRLQQIEVARSEAEARVVGAWSQLVAARARIEADTVQVTANQTALTGVREEERVGQRTLLDVLNAEIELLDAQVQLVTSRRDNVVGAYSLLSAVGALDIASLGFDSVAYDPEAHYEEVRRKPWGTSITHEDGTVEELPVEPVK